MLAGEEEDRTLRRTPNGMIVVASLRQAAVERRQIPARRESPSEEAELDGAHIGNGEYSWGEPCNKRASPKQNTVLDLVLVFLGFVF